MPARKPTNDQVKRAAELAELFHERDISLTTRTIYLGSPEVNADGDEGGVDARCAEVFIKNMHVLESLSDASIQVILNSVGGDEYHGLAICDAIRHSSCDVHMVVRGHAMSMGSVILQAADWRVMGPRSVQLLHYGTNSLSGHSKTVWKNACEGERLNRLMEETYLARIREKQPRYTLRVLRRLLDHDTYLSAAESVALGLCDEVG